MEKKKRKPWLRLLTLVLFFGTGASLYFLLTKLGFLMPLSELPLVLAETSNSPGNPSLGDLATSKLKDNDFFNSKRSLSEILGSNIQLEKTSILIEKSKYRLTLFYDLQPVKSYPVVFGGNPSGTKLHEGDQKTPEGKFHLRDIYGHEEFSRFLWIDYPTPQSWREHFNAKLAGKVNWLFPIGGQIGIHGGTKQQNRELIGLQDV
jgi:murein L,D-transpeptidase YafK